MTIMTTENVAKEVHSLKLKILPPKVFSPFDQAFHVIKQIYILRAFFLDLGALTIDFKGDINFAFPQKSRCALTEKVIILLIFLTPLEISCLYNISHR